MLQNLIQQPPDKILMLSDMFRADSRAHKIDLGVGVYKNAEGQTPIMRAVKEAEKQLWAVETTKTYVSLVGDQGFRQAMADLVLGDSVGRDRIASAATPGGTGAVRLVLDTIKKATPGVTVWTSDPTWGNHLTMLAHVGLDRQTYRYIDPETRTVDFDGMTTDLAQAQAGDVVLLHGCCHNPTGANLNQVQWQAVRDLLNDRGLIPFIDIAYQGFGDGLVDDAYGVRLLAAGCPQLMIAASCSKNFGIYRERTGLAMAVSENPLATPIVQGNLAFLNRQSYSFPPDHGARLVTMVLNDPALRTDWEAELEEVRTSMLDLRKQLADALRAETGSDRFGFIAEHRGMFSRLGLSEAQVDRLRDEHAIYIVGDSRFNVAGLNADTIPVLAKAIAAVE